MQKYYEELLSKNFLYHHNLPKQSNELHQMEMLQSLSHHLEYLKYFIFKEITRWENLPIT